MKKIIIIILVLILVIPPTSVSMANNVSANVSEPLFTDFMLSGTLEQNNTVIEIFCDKYYYERKGEIRSNISAYTIEEQHYSDELFQSFSPPPLSLSSYQSNARDIGHISEDSLGFYTSAGPIRHYMTEYIIDLYKCSSETRFYPPEINATIIDLNLTMGLNAKIIEDIINKIINHRLWNEDMLYREDLIYILESVYKNSILGIQLNINESQSYWILNGIISFIMESLPDGLEGSLEDIFIFINIELEDIIDRIDENSTTISVMDLTNIGYPPDSLDNLDNGIDDPIALFSSSYLYWGISLILIVIVIFIKILKRKPETICQSCGTDIEPSGAWCSECGVKRRNYY